MAGLYLLRGPSPTRENPVINQRWVLSRDIEAMLHSEMEDDIGMKTMLPKPKELQRGRMKLEEKGMSNVSRSSKNGNQFLTAAIHWCFYLQVSQLFNLLSMPS